MPYHGMRQCSSFAVACLAAGHQKMSLAWLGFRFEHELVAIKRDGTMRLQDHQHWEVIKNLIDIITGAQSSLVDIHPRRHGVRPK